MRELNLPDKIRGILDNFGRGLKDIYADDLVSLILYGSAASAEYVHTRSNLNLLVVLKETGLGNLKKAAPLVHKREFRIIEPIFFTEEYIGRSADIFPIEFLDMKENYAVLSGKDVLAGLEIERKNLRFQCEHELKAKLINLKKAYVDNCNREAALRVVLFNSFTSILHIMRSALKLKDREPPYRKEELIDELAAEFKIDAGVLRKILAARNKQVTLDKKDTEELFIGFVRELERTVEAVDRS